MSTRPYSLFALFLLMTFLVPARAAVSVKGTSFSADQLKLGDLIAFDEESKFKAVADLSPEEFLAMSSKDLQALTGEKLSFGERMALRVVKRQAKKQLKKAEKAASLDQVEKADAFKFRILWFIIGLFLPLIGWILAVLLGGEGAGTSALIGGIIGFIIGLIIVL